MDIEEAKRKKKLLEKQIAELLLNYYYDTGLIVSSLEIENVENYIREDIVAADVKVKAEVKF